jgi:hypothetical protein
MIDDAPHIAERAHSEVDPAAPVEGVVDRMIRNILGHGTDV